MRCARLPLFGRGSGLASNDSCPKRAQLSWHVVLNLFYRRFNPCKFSYQQERCDLLTDMLFYSLRREYLEYIVHRSTHLGHWTGGVDSEEEARFREKLNVFTPHMNWYITQRDYDVSHGLDVEIRSRNNEGFSSDEISYFVWSLFQTLVPKDQSAILQDESLLIPITKPSFPELSNFDSEGDYWTSEWSDPRPFGGSAYELQDFRSKPVWFGWHEINLRLTYEVDFNESFGSNDVLEVNLRENFEDHCRVNPAFFKPKKYLERLEANALG